MPSVIGAIREKWTALGGPQSILGQPLTDELTTPDGVGRFNHFQGGSIYWTPQTGAHEIHGAIREKWSSLGFERSLLGYPLTDESTVPDRIGRFNHFQGGSIYWSPLTGAHEIHGAIRDRWAELGFERSFLGYPVTDEVDAQIVIGAAPFILAGRESQFQNGNIKWSSQTGPVVSAEVTQFHADVTTQDWAPIGGSLDLVLNAQGHFTFQGHMHDSGFPNIDFALAAVVMRLRKLGMASHGKDT